MQRRYVIPLAALVAAALVLLTGKISSHLRPGTPSTATSAPTGGAPNALVDIPEFSLLDQDMRPVSPRDLRGRIWVVDFIFTGCAGACPVLSDKMSRLQRETADSRLHFVSFDVDPDHDTPAIVKNYGMKYGADFSRWHFLTFPSRAELFSFARALHVTDQKDDRNFQLLHSDNFILVDGEGKVRGHYDTNQVRSLDQLRADAARLLAR
jgi:protein SCO1/2